MEVQMKPRDFRLYLQNELVARCRKNPSYSLRAFARMLKISPAALSDMLNQRRPITPKMVNRLGLELGVSPTQLNQFQSYSIQLRHKRIKHGAGSQRLVQPIPSFQVLDADVFSIISDWYHDAILELMKVKGFKSDSAWIARKLNITKSEANFALERLRRIGLIAEKRGKWKDLAGGFTTNIIDSKTTSAAAKKYQKQILELSLKALEELSPSDRNHTSMTVAANPRDLPEAIERIKNFRKELCAFLERNQDATEVYQLGVSLFPITKLGVKK